MFYLKKYVKTNKFQHIKNWVVFLPPKFSQDLVIMLHNLCMQSTSAKLYLNYNTIFIIMWSFTKY